MSRYLPQIDRSEHGNESERVGRQIKKGDREGGQVWPANWTRERNSLSCSTHAVVEGHPMILLICCLVRALCCGNGEAKSRQMEYLYRVTTKGLRGEAEFSCLSG